MINNIEEAIFSQILLIAKNVKTLKIVTSRPNNFSYIENKLYDDYGIGIQVTNNKDKALANVEFIINIDFNEEQISKYVLFESATIVNIKNKVKINNLSSKGNIFNYYVIKYDENILEEFSEKSCFDNNVLYESLIYRRDNFNNIKKQMETDGVRLERLVSL